MEPVAATEVNLAHWDELASLHGHGDRIYDVEALVAGRDSRTKFERDAVAAAVGPDLSGVRVLHLQSHIAFDSISMARLGARVTAADFSPVALERAAELAERCGVELETVQADATALPDSLSGRFDLVYANIGAICWIGDLAAWMRSAAGALVPGGALVLYEMHPYALMFDSTDPVKLGFTYAFDGPKEFNDPGSYADANADVKAVTTVNFSHSIGETVGAALDAGLVIERLEEHLESEFDIWGDGGMTEEEDGMWRVRLQGYALPLLFTLIARKPG
jgi:SAM-dependent methyltransferase